MKLTALALVILALGIVLGLALAGGVSEGPASAVPQCPGPSSQCATPTPAPPQQREDQVVILASEGFIGGQVFGPVGGAGIHVMAFDPADYPSGATFRFEATWAGSVFVQTCFRLLDRVARVNIAESEVCFTRIEDHPFAGEVRIRSAPFTLPAGEHEYKIQGKCDVPGCNATVGAARIIVEWTE